MSQVRGPPGRGIKGEGKIDQWIKGNKADYLNTPMGQRPGEFLIKFGSKMWVLGGSWGSKNRSWEGSWGVLGGSWVPRAKKGVRP